MPPAPEDLPLHSRNHLPPTISSGTSANPKDVHALIHRVKGVEDLLAVFMDSSIIQSTLKMEFVNENAVDDAGVYREVYTAFWDQFLEQCEGEDERVPRLRPDFCEAEWEAVGRIWVKGLLDLGVLPLRLSSAFILACMHGIDSVSDDVLMSSFHNYLSLTERSAIAKAHHRPLEECDEEDLFYLLRRKGSHCIPPKNTMEVAIQTMAHKAILQEPKYIIEYIFLAQKPPPVLHPSVGRTCTIQIAVKSFICMIDVKETLIPPNNSWASSQTLHRFNIVTAY